MRSQSFISFVMHLSSFALLSHPTFCLISSFVSLRSFSSHFFGICLGKRCLKSSRPLALWNTVNDPQMA